MSEYYLWAEHSLNDLGCPTRVSWNEFRPHIRHNEVWVKQADRSYHRLVYIAVEE